MKKHGAEAPEAFAAKPLIYKVKREQPASKKQKEDLRYLLKYHKIDLPVQIDYLSRNEVSVSRIRLYPGMEEFSKTKTKACLRRKTAGTIFRRGEFYYDEYA